MVKKTLLSVAIAASVAALAGCNVSSTDKYDDSVNLAPVTSGAPHKDQAGNIVKSTQVIYDPAAKNAAGLPNIPLITDLLLKGLGDPDKIDVVDGTIPFVAKKMGEEGYNPIFSAVTDLDGFSTSSAIDIPFSGPLNAATIKTIADGAAAANVILVPLNYTNDPVTGTNNDGNGVIDATNMFGTPVSITASVVSYTDIEGDVAGAAPITLRIMPNEPLKPATRYLVIVTDSVKDLYGYSVKASNTFSLMASTKTPFADPTKKTLQDTIQTWTKLAVGFTGGLGQKNTVGNIAYATTFTTGGTTTVLASMAAPSLVNEAVKQPLPAAARYQIEKALVDKSGDIQQATGQVAGWIQTLAGSADPATQATGEALITALGGPANMTTNLGGLVTLAKALPQPAPRVAEFDADVTSMDTGGLKMRNGSIKLPYYLSAPQMNPAVPESLATAAYTITSIWQADNTLATDLSALLGAVGIPAAAVTPPSDKVTRHFPLAKTGAHTGADGMGLVDVPISVFYDASATCTDGYNPVIYQHGITSKRTAAIPFTLAAKLVDPCVATVAIDLPLHGLEPSDAAILGALYTHPLASTPANDVAYGMSKQRHFGLTSTNEGKPTAFGATDAKVGAGSGSLFINILNFQGTRDNLRQAVMDQLNLNASIRFLDTNTAQGRDTGLGIKFKEDAPVKFVGHSLGAIVGTNVVALTNALSGESGPSNYLNKVEASVLANGGGVLTKLLENSPAFSSTIMGGFAALGQQAGLPLSQGTSLMELTLHILQATVDSADPINFAGMLKSSAATSGVLALEVVGDGTATNPADQVVPPAAFEANGLKPMVLNDTDTTNDKYADTAASPLAGTTPLVNFAGLTPVDAAVTGTDYLRHVIKYTAGTHSSFGLAVTDDNGSGPGVAISMDAVSFLANGGKGLTINDSSIVKSAE